MTPFEDRDSLDAVKCFAEIDGDKQMNVILNELIKKWKRSGYKMLYKVLCICFLRNGDVSYHT